MKQREVQAEDGVRWVCVQALGGGDDQTADTAADKLSDDEGRVPVVCTPDGGARSVRVRLRNDWIDCLSDPELRRAITEAQNEHAGQKE